MKKKMGFPRRKTVIIPQTPPVNNKSPEDNKQRGFPIRQMVSGAKDIDMYTNLTKSTVVVDTGAVKENNVEKKEPIMVEQYQDNSIGVYHEDIKEEIIIKDTVMHETINPTIEIVDELRSQAEQASSELMKKAKAKLNKNRAMASSETRSKAKANPEIEKLKNTPIEELVFHKFTQEELEALSFVLVNKVLRHRHRAFKKKFGDNAFAYENIYDYGDDKAALIRKVLNSNPNN